ncbi:hypothetical protein QQS21_011385 [Conoideocrella luteorostrata]|uniref:Phosphoglycerate mutase n=1 Tax=Conoideocrella luteorostrata TaxID=1105319 RepID=A0AAJ0FTD6_9HYPO|nr:hypothetical protein QQS21_011385 [Conoideocrella luteorostrata]
MPPIIHVIRHAQGVHNLSLNSHHLLDPELTSLGEEQARALGAGFPEVENIQLILSSPLKRAIQTALLGFPAQIEGGLQVLPWPEIQEASALPCDTGKGLPDIKAEFQHLPVDFQLVEPDWHIKQDKWANTASSLLARAQRARQWLSQRPEREIVLVSHGCFLHLLTDDWVNAVNPRGYDYQGTDWTNTEVRSFTIARKEGDEPALCETVESRTKRGVEHFGVTREQQLELREQTLHTWLQWGVISG